MSLSTRRLFLNLFQTIRDPFTSTHRTSCTRESRVIVAYSRHIVKGAYDTSLFRTEGKSGSNIRTYSFFTFCIHLCLVSIGTTRINSSLKLLLSLIFGGTHLIGFLIKPVILGLLLVFLFLIMRPGLRFRYFDHRIHGV